MTSIHRSDSSQRIARRFSLLHTTPVVPEPHIGSRTKSPSSGGHQNERLDDAQRLLCGMSGLFFPAYESYVERGLYDRRWPWHVP